MRSADWKQLARPLLDSEWRLSKTLAYRVPVGWILYGLLGEGSASTPGFYLWTVRMPLFIPSEVISLNWSDRFGGSSRIYDFDDPATSEAIRQAAAQMQAEAESKSLLLDPPGGADNVRMQEARAYGLLLEANAGGATEVLGRVERYEAKYPWESALVSRAAEVRSMLQAGRTGEVLRRLEAWREETMKVLDIYPD
jgi:hypothetical protein